MTIPLILLRIWNISSSTRCNMYITDQHITIRNAIAQDAPQLTAWWNDGAVMAHAGFPNGLGITVEKVAESLATDSDDIRRRLILEYENNPIGEMCYRNEGNGIADIGIKICEPDFQEKGIGRIALSMLIHYLFDRGYTKIVLDTDLENKRAQHVYEKLGFRKLRVNENSWKNQLGQWRSSVDYELTADTFHNFAV